MSSSGFPGSPSALLACFGRIDIYLFDQLLRGRITPRMRVLDAGCGDGRNCEYLLRCGADVFGVDAHPDRIRRVQTLAAECAPGLPPDNFRVAGITRLPFPDDHFQAVICSAVLHFAEDERPIVAFEIDDVQFGPCGAAFFVIRGPLDLKQVCGFYAVG